MCEAHEAAKCALQQQLDQVWPTIRHSAAVVRFGRADGSADGSPSVIIANDRHLGGSTLNGSAGTPRPARQDVRPTRADRSPEPSFAIRGGGVEYGNER